MQTTTTPAAAHPFTELLARALDTPGTINTAYSAFHDFSLGNQILAFIQCSERGITPGPLATFPRWKDRGRFVRKGEKALTLCMPVSCKRTAPTTEADADAPQTFTRFIFRPRWFALAQTDGPDYTPAPLPEWDRARALEALDVQEIPYDLASGNCFGYARARQVAISPLCPPDRQHGTLFHELAHVLLGHTAEAEQHDDATTPRTLREVEAESVAMLVCAALSLPGIEDSRGYIQHWNRSGEAIPERSAARIFKTADAILKAGRPTVTADDEEHTT